MGTAFVVWILFIVGLGIACLCSLALGAFTWRFVRQAGKGQRIRVIVTLALWPPASVVCGLLGFGGYGFLCEAVWGVDAGIGDVWRVPLGSGYQLILIDTEDNACVESPSGQQFGFNTPRLGFDDKAIYFEAERGTFQLIEKRNGKISAGLSKTELAMNLQSLGSPVANLFTPAQVYSNFGWGLLDFLAILMILGPPAILTFVVGLYVRKIWY